MSTSSNTGVVLVAQNTPANKRQIDYHDDTLAFTSIFPVPAQSRYRTELNIEALVREFNRDPNLIQKITIPVNRLVRQISDVETEIHTIVESRNVATQGRGCKEAVIVASPGGYRSSARHVHYTRVKPLPNVAHKNPCFALAAIQVEAGNLICVSARRGVKKYFFTFSIEEILPFPTSHSLATDWAECSQKLVSANLLLIGAQVEDQVNGTSGYIDPEYASSRSAPIDRVVEYSEIILRNRHVPAYREFFTHTAPDNRRHQFVALPDDTTTSMSVAAEDFPFTVANEVRARRSEIAEQDPGKVDQMIPCGLVYKVDGTSLTVEFHLVKDNAVTRVITTSINHLPTAWFAESALRLRYPLNDFAKLYKHVNDAAGTVTVKLLSAA